MAIAKPEVEWFNVTNDFFVVYGVLHLAGKWAVVKTEGFLEDDYTVITEWVDDRKTAIGFIKLLKE
jgi:hypothetical protein